MMELRILNHHLPLTEHAASEQPADKRDHVAIVQLEDSGQLFAAVWNGSEWRDDKRRKFKFPVARWYSIGDAHVSA